MGWFHHKQSNEQNTPSTILLRTILRWPHNVLLSSHVATTASPPSSPFSWYKAIHCVEPPPNLNRSYHSHKPGGFLPACSHDHPSSHFWLHNKHACASTAFSISPNSGLRWGWWSMVPTITNGDRKSKMAALWEKWERLVKHIGAWP